MIQYIKWKSSHADFEIGFIHTNSNPYLNIHQNNIYLIILSTRINIKDSAVCVWVKRLWKLCAKHVWRIELYREGVRGENWMCSCIVAW